MIFTVGLFMQILGAAVLFLSGGQRGLGIGVLGSVIATAAL